MASEEFSNLHFFIHVIYDGLRWRKWGIKQFFSFFFFFMIVSWNDNFRKKSAFSCIENFQVIKLHKVRLLDTTHPAPSLKCDPIFFQECRNIFRGRKNLHIHYYHWSPGDFQWYFDQKNVLQSSFSWVKRVCKFFFSIINIMEEEGDLAWVFTSSRKKT